ncbi:hypothetical protein A4R28_31265 (plasmid) [Mesorhizobium ciceri]|nr:hypothetical protein A4R28_31265 [Mesorhizobium ciceri]
MQISGAEACSAIASGAGTTVGSGISAETTFETTSVTVECSTTGNVQDVGGVFTTGFAGYKGQANDSSTVIVNDYDGNGDDIVSIFGGILDNSTPTPVISGLPPVTSSATTSLQSAEGTLELFGGNDRFEMSYGDLSGDPFAPNVDANLDAGAGDDTVIIQAGSIHDIDLGDGVDSVVISGSGTQVGNVTGGIGDDLISVGILEVEEGVFFSEPIVGIISGGEGGDTITIGGGNVEAVDAGAGDDQVSIGGNTAIELDIDGEAGNDTITVSGNATIGGSIFGNDGNDTVNIDGGTVGTTISPGIVDLAGGADIFNMTAGHVTGSVFGEGGGNTYTVSGGTVDGSIYAGSQDDSVSISGNASVGIDPGEGGEGTDSVGLEDGDDTFDMTGGTLAGAVSGGAGNDVITLRGGTINSFLEGNDGNDQILVSGGVLAGEVTGDVGDDLIVISGGAIGSSVSGGAGFDNVSVTGGTITGGIDAEHVHLSGGTIGGNITGLGPDTLVIDGIGAVDPLSLSDGVLFSGTGANGTITGTNLAAGGKSQNFTGFDNFSSDNSTLRFNGGIQGINHLNLGSGSTLFINGNVTMPGSIIATNSLIDMTNGVAGDVLTLGGLTLNGASIGLDINQQTSQSDQLIADAFSATGANTIIVNLLGTPQFAEPTDIPLIVSANGPVTGTFSVAGVPGTPGSLFTYAIVTGPNGSVFLRATPVNFGIAAAPTSATNAGAVTVAIEALYGINRDALDADLNLSPASGSGMVPVSESFGVFASGQFAHTEHDGYNISGGGLNGPGPSFDANDFSAAISLDFNAAKHFQFDNEYGLNIGVFAGYASTDVNLGAFRGFDAIGEGTNKAGLFGGYALFRKDYNYALVSASGFIGGSDVTNGVLGTTGSYDTKGYAVTASVGHIFKLGERTRFDLRGGLLGVSFRGDPYTDSGGNEFGKSQLSFGAIKLEPGIYGDYTLSNGMVISPYARGELQQRFGYKNTTEIDTREIDFDDADFSAALSTGFNLKMSAATTVNGEVRGKVSSDSSTIGAKLGLKIAF